MFAPIHLVPTMAQLADDANRSRKIFAWMQDGMSRSKAGSEYLTHAAWLAEHEKRMAQSAKFFRDFKIPPRA